MIIKPIIRNNIALNSHPLGCQLNILHQIEELNDKELINESPINVLIIGGSSGYGLATRLVLALKANAYTYNVSYESGPRKRSSGTAGFYNNYYVKKHFMDNNIPCDDLNADCFSNETKQLVVDDFKRMNKKIDMIIYSVASGVRVDPVTNEKYTSALKPINKSFNADSIDLSKKLLKNTTIEPASNQEIAETIKVMGGEDFLLWMEVLKDNDLLNDNVKALAYTYIGSPITYDIYKDGTIGQAKRDLEKKNEDINNLLASLNGTSYICSSQSVITKASIYIPGIALYVSSLNKVMKEKNKYESIIDHKYRLFSEMIFKNNIILDDNNIIRLDAIELEEDIQKDVIKLMNSYTPENFYELLDVDQFRTEFYNLNGFEYDSIDYDLDLNLDEYLSE
ncbi:enoyl-ACP reductase FabV [Mycoplasma sp. P36-A1]|uniref:enoyl-ACP reductase FabV n=1 Tax=Mycoplasma sp. P36-A1 TaxID=3252900 RepID=UPI003C2DFD26